MADIQITADAQQAISTINSVKSALTGLVSAAAVKELTSKFIEVSDSITSMKNKLVGLTGDFKTANDQFKALGDIASSSRSSLEETVNLYNKLAVAGKSFGVTQQEAAKFTELLNKSLAGTDPTKKNETLNQIGQALGQGRFNGDELKRVLEQATPLAQKFAEYMGTTIGQLKQMGAEGKISTETFLNFLRATGPEIEKSFGQLKPTIGEAIQRIKDAFTLLFNEIENRYHLAENFAAGLNKIADFINNNREAIADFVAKMAELGKVLAAIAGAAAAVAVFSGIAAAIRSIASVIAGVLEFFAAIRTALAGLGAAEAAAGLTGFAGALSGLLGPLGQVVRLLMMGASAYLAWKGYKDVFGGVSTSGAKPTTLESSLGTPDGASVGGETGIGPDGQTTGVGAASSAFNQTAVQNAEALKAAITQIHTIGQQSLATYQAQNAEKLKELEYQNSLIGLKDQEREKVQLLHEEALNFYKAITPLQEQYEQLSKQGTEEATQKAAAIKEEIDKITQAHEQYSQKITEILDKKQQALEAAKRQEEAEHAIAAAAEKRKQIEGEIANLKNQQAEKVRNAQQQLDLKGLSGVQREMKRIQYEEDNWAESAKNRVKEQWGEGDQQGLQQRLAEIDAIKQKTTQDLQGIAQQSSALEQQHTQSHQRLSQGWGNTMNTMRQQSQQATTEVGGMFNKMTSGITDSLMNMVKTGKFDAKSLISAFEPLMKGGLNMLFNSLLGGGGKGGGIFDGLFGSAAGGVGGLSDSIGGLTNQLGSLQGAMGPNGRSGDPAFVNVAGGLDPLLQGFDQLGQTFSTGLDSLGSSLGGLFDGISGLFNGAGSSGGGLLGGLFGGGGGSSGGGGGFLGDIFGGGGGRGSSGGGIFDTIGGFFDDIGSSFSGFFAQGGTIPGGKFGVVGENGPEFVSGPATVTPMGGGSSVVNYNINAVDALSFKQMLARDPGFIHAVAMKGASGTPGRR